MSNRKNSEGAKKLNRRKFIGGVAAAGGAAIIGSKVEKVFACPRKMYQDSKKFDIDSVTTNLKENLKPPASELSMPGLFPAAVCEVHKAGAIAGNSATAEAAAAMLDAGMLNLTGEKTAELAWKKFFQPKDRIGIKVNPLAGRLLANDHQLVAAVIANLESIGVAKENICIWDRREEDLKETGFTEENFPGIRCTGTEFKVDENGNEVWKSKENLDEALFYEFDIFGDYKEEWLSHQVNGGTKSYFTKTLTHDLDKVINIPVLKNWDESVTLSLKNMAFGTTSNTIRAHRIWHKYIAEVCAFPAIRDKTVLNIVDGLKGCYEGGPSPAARYIWRPETIWLGTDPVAVDHIAWDTVINKRIAEGIVPPEEKAKENQLLDQLVRAEKLGLGVYDRNLIKHQKIQL
jgi:hypothetical protein